MRARVWYTNHLLLLGFMYVYICMYLNTKVPSAVNLVDWQGFKNQTAQHEGWSKLTLYRNTDQRLRSANKTYFYNPRGHHLFHLEQERIAKERRERREREERERRERELREKYDFVYLNSSARDLFQTWVRTKLSLYEGKIRVYGQKVVELKDMVLRRDLAVTHAKGGEKIEDVINRPDADEEYKIEPGYFSIPCVNQSVDMIVPVAGDAPHVKIWAKSVRCCNLTQIPHNKSDTALTMMVQRYEFANVFWIMMELYDAYLGVTFLNRTLSETHLILVDSHPLSHLDQLWTRTFKTVSRPNQLDKAIKFPSLTWNLPRQFSPMLDKNMKRKFPLIDEFRETVLRVFNVSAKYKRSCTSLNILFIWRRNYVAHPRNPKGIISRKISAMA